MITRCIKITGWLLIVIIPLLALAYASVGDIDPGKYGAKCDGVTDDTDAFRRAAASSRFFRKRLIVPDNCVVRYLDLNPAEMEREVK